jgi:hypothetical protein
LGRNRKFDQPTSNDRNRSTRPQAGSCPVAPGSAEQAATLLSCTVRDRESRRRAGPYSYFFPKRHRRPEISLRFQLWRFRGCFLIHILEELAKTLFLRSIEFLNKIIKYFSLALQIDKMTEVKRGIWRQRNSEVKDTIASLARQLHALEANKRACSSFMQTTSFLKFSFEAVVALGALMISSNSTSRDSALARFGSMAMPNANSAK